MAVTWPGVLLLGLGLVSCTSPPAPRFDIGALKPTTEGDQVQLTGWLQIDGQLRLYSEQKHLGEVGKSTCISGVTLSLAGIVPAEFNGKLMAVSGFLHRVGSVEAGAVKDECGGGIVLLATEVVIP